MNIRSSKPSTSGRMVIRVRYCKKCGFSLKSREFAPDYQQLVETLEPFDDQKQPDPNVREPRKRAPLVRLATRKRRVMVAVG